MTSTLETQWQAVIGLEVHVQLKTCSKIFSAAATAYGAAANTQSCDVSIALPGTLPVMNVEAARLAVRFGLAIGACVNQRSVFARKHYFYPDLPKGYQISQYEFPIVGAGDMQITTADGNKTIGITRAHLEEDAGKSLHEDYHGMTGVDFNRAGTPLLEIVSEPDMTSAAEAVAYLRKIHQLVCYLDICDGNMQEGSFRCDANVSVKPAGQQALGTRTELKNINSFRFVEKAIEYEIQRQIEVLEEGGSITQETRLYDDARDETRPMRSKEEAHDYRYFPDPDLPEMRLDDAFIAEVRATLPELPEARSLRLQGEFALSENDAAQLTGEREVADYFEAVMARTEADAKTAANWILGDLGGALNKHDLRIPQSPVDSTQLALLLTRIADRTISGKIAKEVFAALWRGIHDNHDDGHDVGHDVGHDDIDVDAIISKRGLQQITDSAEIGIIIDRIITNHPEQVEQYRAGKQKVFGFFIGQVMKESRGKANPEQVNEILREKLD